MAVTLLVTGYYRHPKLVAANGITGGELAEVLWTRVLDHVNEHETGGLIMAGVPHLVCPRQTKRRIDALVTVGLWDTGPGDSWQVHDYHEWNRTAAEMEVLRQARAAAGRKGAAVRWGGRLPMASGSSSQ